jgi:hypothetical protein
MGSKLSVLDLGFVEAPLKVTHLLKHLLLIAVTTRGRRAWKVIGRGGFRGRG